MTRRWLIVAIVAVIIIAIIIMLAWPHNVVIWMTIILGSMIVGSLSRLIQG